MLTEEWIKKFVADNELFEQAADEASRRYREITGKQLYYDTATIDGDRICFEGDEYWQYGGHEHHYETLPLRALYDNAYWDELEAEKKERDRKNKRAAQRRERTAAKKREKEDLAKLAELQKKYPKEAAAGG